LLLIPIFSAGLLDKRHQTFPLNAIRQHNVFSTFSFAINLSTPMDHLHCFNLKHLSRFRNHPSIAMSLLLICASRKYCIQSCKPTFSSSRSCSKLTPCFRWVIVLSWSFNRCSLNLLKPNFPPCNKLHLDSLQCGTALCRSFLVLLLVSPCFL